MVTSWYLPHQSVDQRHKGWDISTMPQRVPHTSHRLVKSLLLFQPHCALIIVAPPPPLGRRVTDASWCLQSLVVSDSVLRYLTNVSWCLCTHSVSSTFHGVSVLTQSNTASCILLVRPNDSLDPLPSEEEAILIPVTLKPLQAATQSGLVVKGETPAH